MQTFEACHSTCVSRTQKNRVSPLEVQLSPANFRKKLFVKREPVASGWFRLLWGYVMFCVFTCSLWLYPSGLGKAVVLFWQELDVMKINLLFYRVSCLLLDYQATRWYTRTLPFDDRWRYLIISFDAWNRIGVFVEQQQTTNTKTNNNLIISSKSTLF